eukprot:scaffold14974_cov195-Amphora_coffeaeformis.AAC.20
MFAVPNIICVGMFLGADKFNGDISRWDVSKVQNLKDFANRAKLFKKNLCAWGLRLPGDVYFGEIPIFFQSSCPDARPPDMSASPPGPFCHFCN